MSGLALNLVAAAIENKSFRRVIHTSGTQQLTVSSLKGGEDLSAAANANVTQTFFIASGEGIVDLGNESFQISPGVVIVVPVAFAYSIRNTSEDDLKIYAIHSPPLFSLQFNQIKKPDELPGCACDT